MVTSVRNGKVGEFNAVKNLSLGFSGSYEVEPVGLDRVEELLHWSSQFRDEPSQLPPSQLPR